MVPSNEREARSRATGDDSLMISAGEMELTTTRRRTQVAHGQEARGETREERSEAENDGHHHAEEEQEEEDDDNITVILLDDPEDGVVNHSGLITLDWIHQHGPEMEQRRRTVLLHEIRRIQRAAFCRFALLCLVPTVLLMVVMLALAADGGEDCASDVTQCVLEPRTFANAFTTRCVCEPVPVELPDPAAEAGGGRSLGVNSES